MFSRVQHDLMRRGLPPVASGCIGGKGYVFHSDGLRGVARTWIRGSGRD